MVRAMMRTGHKRMLVFLGMFTALTCLAFNTGCTAPWNRGGVKEVRMTLIDRNTVRVGRRSVKVRRLPAVLRSMGATDKTGIIISASPQRVPTELARQLSRAGFPRVVFAGPQRAVSRVKDR